MTTPTGPGPATLAPDSRLRCSDWARDAELSPAGTMGCYPGFLLLEIPLPWPRDVGQTAQAREIAPITEPLGWRLQAIVPENRTRPEPERRVVLHVAPPAADGFNGYRRLETVVGDSLTDAVTALARAAERPEPTGFDVPGVDLLLCTHGTRDSCCGRRGAALAAQLSAGAARPGVNLWRTSHTGGHRFAPTFVVLPEGTCWGYADSDVVDRVLTRRGDFSAVAGHYRGCSGLAHRAVQALETEALRQEGWPVLDRLRHSSFEAGRAELSWTEGPRTVSWQGEIGTGRAVPMVTCQQPASAGTQPELEWAVRSVHRSEELR